MLILTVDLLLIAPSDRHPLRLEVLVSPVVRRQDVQFDGVGLVGIKTTDFHGEYGKHSPVCVHVCSHK